MALGFFTVLTDFDLFILEQWSVLTVQLFLRVVVCVDVHR